MNDFTPFVIEGNIIFVLVYDEDLFSNFENF